MDFASKAEIRRQIWFRGKKNELRQWSDIIAYRWEKISQSHLAFVKLNHLRVEKYSEACEDRDAAIISLSILKDYNNQGNDPLFQEYYTVFKEVVATGSEQSIENAKAIRNFVRFPEVPSIDYSKSVYTYSQLYKLAKYKTVQEYPAEYFMLYDGINEFDLILSDKEKDQVLQDYVDTYLTNTPYKPKQEKSGLVTDLHRAIKVLAKTVSRKSRKKIQSIIDGNMDYRKGKVSGARCAAGLKRSDFWIRMFQYGVTAEVYPSVDEDISKIERLYNVVLERPKIGDKTKEPRVIGKKDYHTRLIIQPDPKKARIAYESNPLKDYIGDPGMDVIVEVFWNTKWIQTGKKRTTLEDFQADKHRYYSIRSAYNKAKEYGVVLQSTDLSKATEHLNMCEIMDVIKELLNQLGIQHYDQFVEDTYSQLYLMPIMIAQSDELYYSRCGQTQGVPGSFHTMTLILALINMQSALDTSSLKPWQLQEILQNNGDDGTNLKCASQRYKQLLFKLTGSHDVFNDEKSYSSDLNNSLEFCKTIYYENNENLITGYRLSSVYKITGNAEAMFHLVDDRFEWERHILANQLPNYEAMDLDPVRTIAARNIVDMDPEYISRCNEVLNIARYEKIQALYQNKDGFQLRPAHVVVHTPQSWLEFIPNKKVMTVLKPGFLTAINMQLYDDYFDSIELGWDITEVSLLEDSLYEEWRDNHLWDEKGYLESVRTQTYVDGQQIEMVAMRMPYEFSRIYGDNIIILSRNFIDMTKSGCQVVISEAGTIYEPAQHSLAIEVSHNEETIESILDRSRVLQNDMKTADNETDLQSISWDDI